MFTDCKDPNCVKCKQQASKGKMSVEGNQSKISETVKESCEEGSLLKTIEEMAAKDLLSAVMARGDCLTSSRRLKEEVHFQINALISVLRERELDLCIEIEREHSAQVQKIDHDLTVNCVDKIMKRYKDKRPPSRTALVFNSDFNALKRKLKCFGQLKYEDTKVHTEANKEAFSMPSLPSFEDLQCPSMYDAKNTTPLFSTSPVTLATLAESVIINEQNERQALRWISKIQQQREERRELEPSLEYMQRKMKEFYELLTDAEMPEPRYSREESVRYQQEANRLRERIIQRMRCARKDEPETLSAQIRKRFGMLANRPMEGQKGEGMAYPSMAPSNLESIVSDKEVGKGDTSLGKHEKIDLDRETAKLIMEKSLASLRSKTAKFAELDLIKDKITSETDLKNDKITSQSCESMDLLSNEEDEKDCSWDEDDIEIITRMEAESILPDCSPSLPLPPKNRFKSSRLASLFRRKGDKKRLDSPRNSEKSESSDIGESESHASLSCAVSSCGNSEVKENPSSNQQPDQKSSSECPRDFEVECQDSNPTVALRLSFTKYLEKNPESEWLACGKTSEQPLLTVNSCKERVVPIFVQELDQWLPTEYNQKMTSDWLYHARM